MFLIRFFCTVPRVSRRMSERKERDAFIIFKRSDLKAFDLDRGAGLQHTSTEESWFALSLLLFVVFFSSGNLCLSSETRDFFKGNGGVDYNCQSDFVFMLAPDNYFSKQSRPRII